MIRRDDDHTTSSAIDAPSWLEPGSSAPATAPQDTTTVRRTPYATTRDATTRPDLAPSAVRPPGPPIRRVQHFALLERVAAGGRGEVFAAVDEKRGRQVAIELVAAQASGDTHQRLSREAHALARLSHPNVVTIYEVGTLPDGGLFIAMELVSGQTLRTWQRAHRGAWREIVSVYVDAGRGLAAAHKRGIVHRDLTPDNILIGDDGRVRVAGFGLASANDDARSAPVLPAAETPVAEPARAPSAEASAALPIVDVTAGSSPARRSGSLLARASASLRRVEASAAMPLVELNAALRAAAPQGVRTGEPPAKLADASAALPPAEPGAGLPGTDASAALPFADIVAALPATEASAALPLAEMSAALPVPDTTEVARGVTSAALPADAGPAAPTDENRSASPFLEPVAERSRGHTRAAWSGTAPGATLPRREQGRSRAGGAHAASTRDEISAALPPTGPSTALSRPAPAAARADTGAGAAWSHDEIGVEQRDIDTSATLAPVIEESAAMSPLPDREPPFHDPDTEPTGVEVSAALLRLDTSTALSSSDSSAALPIAGRNTGRSGTEASTGFFRIDLPAASPNPELGASPRAARWSALDRQATWPIDAEDTASSSAGSAAGSAPTIAAGTRSPAGTRSAARSAPTSAAAAADPLLHEPAEIPPYAAADDALLRATADFESTLDLDTDLLPAIPPPRFTAAGRFIGTSDYLAPEQLAGTAVDARADQYSFCVALYEALHGERPALAATPRARRGADAPYPRWLADLLQRGLSRDPALRFATMDALLAELTLGRERARQRTAVAILVGALIAAAAAVVIAAMR